MQQLGGPFEGVLDYYMKNCEEFKVMYDETEAHESKLPGGWNDKLNIF